MVSVGIIGVGNWGKNLLRVFDKLSTVKWTAYKESKETERWIKEHYPAVRITREYSEILNDKTVDAVIISTPISTHYKIAKDALAAGKHVFVEKPLALNKNEVKELYDLARKKKLVLFVGYIFLYHPCYIELKKLVGNDAPVMIETDWKKYGSFGESIFQNLAVHDWTLVYDLTGNPPDSFVMKTKKGVKTDADIISLCLESKKYNAIIKIDRVSKKKEKRVTVKTRSGKEFVWKDNTILVSEKSRLKPIFRNEKEPLQEEVAAFLSCIKEGVSPDDADSNIFIAKLSEKF